METKELCEKIKILLKKKKSFVDICKELQLKDYEVIGLVNLMKQDDTHCFQTSCLEDLTPFARSMGFANDKSVWWVDVEMNDKGQIQNITQELETFNTKKLVRRK